MQIVFIAIKSQRLLRNIITLYEKHICIVCLAGLGLNNIFPRYPHWLINFKSLFTSISECILFIILGKRNLSLANILRSEITPSGKSFIYIRNNNGPKTYPCGTPAKMFFHEDVYPFKMFLSIFQIILEKHQQVTIYTVSLQFSY